jgi:hypothetical protein
MHRLKKLFKNFENNFLTVYNVCGMIAMSEILRRSENYQDL